MSHFSISRLTLAVAVALTSGAAFSAGMDRSGQDIKGFFNEGTYAEIDYVYIDTKVSGHDNAGTLPTNPPKSVGITKTVGEYRQGNKIDNITSDPYSFVRYGAKADINDTISVGVFYDHPWGAEVEVKGDNAFVAKPGAQVLVDPDTGMSLPEEVVNANITRDDYQKGTKVVVHTDSITGILGVKSNGFQVYGGPVLQKASAEVHLRGQAYGPLTGYDAQLNHDTALGWLAGVSYSKPEIALNAALTYRSAIKHEGRLAETIPLLDNPTLKGIAAGKLDIDPAILQSTVTTTGKVTTPESVNLNLQSGLSAKHQLMGTLDVRWVPWSEFSIVPPMYNGYSKAATGKDSNGLPLLDYDKDQWKVDVGLAKRFNDKLAGSVQVGWDSGAGNPVSSLGPIEGYWSVGGGVKYNVTPEWAVSVGGKYLMFGDAHAKLPNGSIVGEFKDNTGYIAGVKLSYQGK